MGGGVPAISGPELAKLLKDDGWIAVGRNAHGIAYKKVVDGKPLIATIPTDSRSLPKGTLRNILSPKQTGLGREGLLRLVGGDTEKQRARKAKRTKPEE